MAKTPNNALIGWLAIATGLGCAWMITANPEQLNVPAWVAYIACAVFVCGGLAGLLQVHGRLRLASLAALGILVGLTVVAGWIAFGPGARTCSGSASLPFLGVGRDLAGLGCRIPFGIGAALCASITAAALLAMLRPRPADAHQPER